MAVKDGTDAGDILDTPEAGPLAIRGGVLRVLGYAAGIVLSVASAAVLLRHLTVADFGRYGTVLALVTIVSGLSEAGMTSVGVREYATRRAEDRTRFMRSLLGLRLVLTLGGVALAVAFALVARYERPMVWGTALWGLGIVAGVAAATYAVPLQAELRLGLATGTELLRQAVSVALIVALVLAGAGLLPLLAVALPAGLAMLAATAWLVRGRAPFRPRFAAGEWRQLLAVTVPFAVASAVGTIYVYVSQVLMSLVATETETGLFAASFRVWVVLAGIPALLVSAVFPILARAARDDRDRHGYAMQRMFEISLLLGTGAALVTAVGAPVILEIVAGPGYEGAVDVLRLHALALLASFQVAVGAFGLLSLHRNRGLLAANGLALLTSVALTLALVGPLGAEGAALANVAGESALAAAYGIALHRAGLRLSPSILAKILPAAAAGGFVPALGLPALAATILAGAAYLAVVLALGAVPPEVGQAFLRRRG
jgi:O-antigen/teichoic acid export membrane protein